MRVPGAGIAMIIIDYQLITNLKARGTHSSRREEGKMKTMLTIVLLASAALAQDPDAKVKCDAGLGTACACEFAG